MDFGRGKDSSESRMAHTFGGDSMTEDSVGDKIRAARLQKGWTHRRLSAECGYTQQSIATWERGEHRPSPRALKSVERALGVKLLDKEE